MRRGARTEQGAVAIVVAAAILGLLIIAAMVLDFGLARLDRQVNKSAADSAVAAGIRGFDTGDGQVHSYRGVCQAIDFLASNVPALSTISWVNCTNANFAKVCDPAVATTHAKFSQVVGGYRVWIEAPYTLPDETHFPEDDADTFDGDDGEPCNQLAVIIEQSRKPGLGSLAGDGDLTTTIRSVGRVDVGTGDQAPALLLLDRQHCRVLQVAAGGSGAESSIHVKGATAYQAVRADGTAGQVYTSGSIHADTNASVCSGGNPAPPVFLGKASAGIAAYGPPSLPPPGPSAPTPGIITSVAGLSQPLATIRDAPANVFGTTAEFGVAGGTPVEPTGRGLVTRRLVNERYLTGVTNAVSGASTYLNMTPGDATLAGFQVIDDCAPTAAVLATIPIGGQVYFNCTGGGAPAFKGLGSGTTTINAGTVVFNSHLDPAETISMPYATHVYVQGNAGKDALTLSTGKTFSMHTNGNLTGSNCTTGASGATPPNKAIMFVKQGAIKENGGLLQMCRTTMIMLGGQADACLPTGADITAPPGPNLTTPCGGSYGSGQLTITGGAEDWTAPDEYDDMTGMSDADKESHWNDVNGMEDLAFWSESGGVSSNPNYQMAGGGSMRLRGVFMTPNAGPFTVNGGGGQTLTNAQYIAASFQVTGGATLDMTVDPNNAIALPELTPFTLVR